MEEELSGWCFIIIIIIELAGGPRLVQRTDLCGLNVLTLTVAMNLSITLYTVISFNSLTTSLFDVCAVPPVTG